MAEPNHANKDSSDIDALPVSPFHPEVGSSCHLPSEVKSQACSALGAASSRATFPLRTIISDEHVDTACTWYKVVTCLCALSGPIRCCCHCRESEVCKQWQPSRGSCSSVSRCEEHLLRVRWKQLQHLPEDSACRSKSSLERVATVLCTV